MCGKESHREGVDRNLQPETEKVKRSQADRADGEKLESSEEWGSMGKDRQKDRNSLSHSRGGGNKRRLQRE